MNCSSQFIFAPLFFAQKRPYAAEILEVAPKAVAMAMGIAVTVLTILNELDTKSAMIMLGIGLACAGISLMSEKK